MPLVPALTDLSRHRVAVPADDVCYPEGCLFCGHPRTSLVAVTFNRISLRLRLWPLLLLLLFPLDDESVMIRPFLCATHLQDHKNRQRTRFWIRIALYLPFVVFLGLNFGLLWMLDRGLYPNRTFFLSCFACILVAAGALLCLRFGVAPLPLRLHQRSYGPFLSLSLNPPMAWVFKFDDAAAAQRFADANRE